EAAGALPGVAGLDGLGQVVGRLAGRRLALRLGQGLPPGPVQAAEIVENPPAFEGLGGTVHGRTPPPHSMPQGRRAGKAAGPAAAVGKVRLVSLERVRWRWSTRGCRWGSPW